MYVSVYRVSIGIGAPNKCQAITWTNAAILLIDILGIFSINAPANCHFVSASVCYNEPRFIFVRV